MKPFDERSWTCFHLVLDFYDRELGIALPRYGLDRYPSIDVAREIGEAAASGAWQQIDPDQERFGDVVTFRGSRDWDGHVAVVVKPLHIMHVMEGHFTRIERRDRPELARLVSGIYRWRKKVSD